MAGKEKLESYSPKMVHAGDFPVVTDSGTVASGETIHELMPITLGADGKIKAVTADTVADVYGLAAENAEEGEEVVYYLTGEFFGSAIEVPVGKTAADFKAPFRKIGISSIKNASKASAPIRHTLQFTKPFFCTCFLHSFNCLILPPVFLFQALAPLNVTLLVN